MSTSSTTKPKIQAETRAHPTLFDKQIWINAIMRRKDIRASAKNLAWSLADHHNQRTGLCNPSTTTLAEATGTARSVVNENLEILQEAGIISWTSGNSSRSNRYVLKGVEIHDRTAKPASPAPQRGKPPVLRLVPKDDHPASETVRPGGQRLSVPADNQPSAPPDTNTRSLTPEGTLPPLGPSSASGGPAAPFSPSTGHQGAQDSTHTNQPARKPRETTWPDDLGWSKEVRDIASDYQAHGNTFIKEAFFAFKAHALKNSRRSTDWRAAWLTWYKEACRIESDRHRRSRSAGI